MDQRGRLTLPDVMFVTMSFAFLAALYPVFAESYRFADQFLAPGSRLLYQAILPLALLVLLTVIYVKAGAS
jgi:hypothetical protein